MGLAYLRLDDHQRAFDYLGNALTHDPRNVKACWPLVRYTDNGTWTSHCTNTESRVCDTGLPQFWNNVGMALFGKGKNIAAISCLKKGALPRSALNG